MAGRYQVFDGWSRSFIKAGRPGEAAQSPEAQVGPHFCGYRPVLIFVASCVCASARQLTIATATAASALGVAAVTEGFAGQTTMTKLGLVSG